MKFQLLALASSASLVAAQGAFGYGRYGCSLQNGDGTYSADQTRCADPLTQVGANIPRGGDIANQGDGQTPTGAGLTTSTGALGGPQCVKQPSNTGYFCGIAGAICVTDGNCDNGFCTNGVCTGDFGTPCAGNDRVCSGLTYCTDAGSAPTTANTCGGYQSFCGDYTQGSTLNTAAENQAIFNQFCASGFCPQVSNSNNTDPTKNIVNQCGQFNQLLASCADDPNSCAPGLVCSGGAAPTCVVAPVASPVAALPRSRRNKRGLCPASHSACSVSGLKAGFECVDTTSNLEQCGACASAGGVDCTALPGVEAVGCVAGQCEIWSCAQGFSWDAASASCQA